MDIVQLVAESNSFSDVLRRQGKAITGNSHKALKKKVLSMGIDTRHFKSGGMVSSDKNKKHFSEVLVYNRSGVGRREHGKVIRRAMIESGIPYECRECGIGPDWRGRPLMIEVHHIDEDFLNNEPGNICFLCPNCHSQHDSTKRRVVHICPECGGVRYKTSALCRGCESGKGRVHNRKIEWPPTQDLIDMVLLSNYSAVGRKLGVTDNAIRKHLQRQTGYQA